MSLACASNRFYVLWQSRQINDLSYSVPYFAPTNGFVRVPWYLVTWVGSFVGKEFGPPLLRSTDYGVLCKVVSHRASPLGENPSD